MDLQKFWFWAKKSSTGIEQLPRSGIQPPERLASSIKEAPKTPLASQQNGFEEFKVATELGPIIQIGRSLSDDQWKNVQFGEIDFQQILLATQHYTTKFHIKYHINSFKWL